MKGNKKYAIIALLVVIVIVLAVVLGIKFAGPKEKIYEGLGIKIILSGDEKVTVYNGETLMGENILLEDIETPEGIENPENYSRFVKVKLPIGEIIAGISKDEKSILVDGMEFTLQK